MIVPPIVARYPHFLHGGDYNPEQWRHMKKIWSEDMRLTKEDHCNAFSIGIFAWTALEPEEGQYDCTWLDEQSAHGLVLDWKRFVTDQSLEEVSMW